MFHQVSETRISLSKFRIWPKAVLPSVPSWSLGLTVKTCLQFLNLESRVWDLSLRV